MALPGGPAAASADAAAAAPPRVPSVHSTAVVCCGRGVLLHATLLDGSVFLWVGDQALGLEHLQVAVPTKYETLPSVAGLRGDIEGPGGGMAQMLSKRFKMLIFLSFNLSNADPELMLNVQREAATFLAGVLGMPSKAPAPVPAALA
eukprot:TRINITY_DN53997_c0_g1_i1.p2 TRINITY_DN53997_c0_g1~~TRINITY_DN53997_c0_g1_i1.p2  ORF type:complete len:162 (+),score=32.21 TRINITY_DN53997_c0_g1_i1:48-488(+)